MERKEKRGRDCGEERKKRLRLWRGKKKEVETVERKEKRGRDCGEKRKNK